MRLIPEWKKAWRMFSVQAMGWGTAMLTAWPALPKEFQDFITVPWYMRIVAFLLVAGVIGRIVDQGITETPKQ